ncbi:MAG TPA: gamma-glutamyl-gamma-aminobutyrate hydrolase family protein [Acidimicrobiales bacterium]|nr:gamma-glutamyl-gamma-aminobutyrate hydrolase family protein [Acidimicrobiales bacterium]
MTRPLVGITTYPPDRDGRVELPQEYVHAVRRAGAEPVLVPPGTADDPVDVHTVLHRLDGLVLAGGGDIDPARYGGGGHETVYAIRPERDRDELALVAGVLERRIPTLAICRGAQVLNVALGGSLVTHLPDAVPSPDAGGVSHRIEPEEVRGRATPTPHEVLVDAGSPLSRVLGADRVSPMSWHHQAVDRLGTGLRVVARAPDGVVEALEVEGHPEVLAVQWHPELTAAVDPAQQALFDALAQRAASFSA